MLTFMRGASVHISIYFKAVKGKFQKLYQKMCMDVRSAKKGARIHRKKLLFFFPEENQKWETSKILTKFWQSFQLLLPKSSQGIFCSLGTLNSKRFPQHKFLELYHVQMAPDLGHPLIFLLKHQYYTALLGEQEEILKIEKLTNKTTNFRGGWVRLSVCLEV